jgi:hypothetical protein
MGVQGAALATVLSQLAASVWTFKFLTGKNTIIKIKMLTGKIPKMLSSAACRSFVEAIHRFRHMCSKNKITRYSAGHLMAVQNTG